MKRSLLLLLVLMNVAGMALAQVGFVNTKTILDKMPEYQEAQKLLHQMGTEWQREIDEKQTVLNRMNADYESERPLLSEDLKKTREENLAKLSLEIKNLERTHFGYGGDLTRKEDTLTKPLREKINYSIQRVAALRKYNIVLDKSEGVTVMFSDAKLDITQDVIRDMGIQ
jgi:outer membrane protein